MPFSLLSSCIWRSFEHLTKNLWKLWRFYPQQFRAYSNFSFRISICNKILKLKISQSFHDLQTCYFPTSRSKVYHFFLSLAFPFFYRPNLSSLLKLPFVLTYKCYVSSERNILYVGGGWRQCSSHLILCQAR